MGDFDKDIELKKLDLVAGDLRAGYYFRLALYLTILIVLLFPLVPFSLALPGFWILVVAVVVIVYRFINAAMTDRKDQLVRLDTLIKEIQEGRSVGTVQEALLRVRGG